MLTNSYDYQSSVFRLITRQLRALIKKDVIRFPDVGGNNYSIAAIFAIQLLRDYNEPEIKISAPEGYRVLINDKDGDVVLSADFYYRRKNLYFSHSFDSDTLKLQIEALNAAQESYRHKKGEFHVCYVEFLLAGQPYLVVYNRRQLNLYTYQDSLLKKISKAHLKSKLLKIQSNIQPLY
ncbi:hypothetical protein PBAL39_12995 [Pedobacter sp. BAL39]|uniref:hypothetical protein n=1 Tax=Pedobacter sp. BAL39 TaxID=391596 RepID=UPI000155944D|nr:hypothetical protein [Pedobacter sp. BAL39]EDM35387.1 hypothetical protein PBAL39_12995 [Pedobacter sp. BAL39]